MPQLKLKKEEKRED